MTTENKLGQPQIELSQTKPVVCTKCGGKIFNQGIVLREVSSLLTGNGKPGLVPIPVFYCEKCGEILPMSIPEEIKNEFTVSDSER